MAWEVLTSDQQDTFNAWVKTSMEAEKADMTFLGGGEWLQKNVNKIAEWYDANGGA